MSAKIQPKKISSILHVANSTKRVSGYTHDFYNYPARFSPLLAREIIQSFTKPGDLVLDPFMGGGTTLIEAKLLNRNSVGFDISTLATFLSNVKLNPVNLDRVIFFNDWMNEALGELNCHRDVCRPESWISKGYQRNLSTRKTWPLRKLIEQFLHKVELSNLTELERDFLRCVLLKTSQWALDSKKLIPNSSKFKVKIAENYQKMVAGSKEFWEKNPSCSSRTVNTPAYNVHKHEALFIKRPKLVLTSPPYPGIHVMYHRWQVFGKKETPAPFWIANSQDGHGLAHYAMGDRKQKGLTDYFSNIKKSFESISHICDENTVVVQVLAFSNIDWQLPTYLKTMEEAGFHEFMSDEKRIWRDVPNRKWYAQKKGSTSSSKEVILFHRLAR
jgi:hypothetical protein